MSLLLHELKEQLLQRFDSNDLLEMLEISAEELLENFSDRVEEKHAYLCEQLEEDTEDGTD